MQNIKKYFMTLALLLTAVTGAWAQTPGMKLFTVPAEWADDNTPLTAADLPADFVDYSTLTDDEAKAIPNPDPSYNHSIFLFYGFNENDVKYILWGDGTHVGKFTVSRKDLYTETTQIQSKIYYTAEPAEPAIDVKWDAKTKTGSFVMPAFDVEIAPIYAPVAQWAKAENVDQLPTAIEGIIAGQDAAIVTAGQSAQGTVMYAVTTSAEAAPALTAFSATVPTAKDYDDATTLYVWYYIQGQDTPDGQEATEENTFNDSEISATPLTVQVLSNKFDIQFKAANANTIEAGKATVTVGGTDKTVTEGKLEGVKMGSEVKVTAKEGYKFRKVEVKKKAASKLASEVTTEDIFKVIASDGMIYDNIAAAQSAGTTAQGLVVYVGSDTGNDTYTHGMALALQDEGDNTWSGAKDACNAKNTSTPIVGALWIQASKDQWNKMFNAVGGDSKLRDCFSSAGGTNIIKFGNYWSGSAFEDSGQQGDFYMFSEDDWPGSWGSTSTYYNDNYHVRACIVF